MKIKEKQSLWSIKKSKNENKSIQITKGKQMKEYDKENNRKICVREESMISPSTHAQREKRLSISYDKLHYTDWQNVLLLKSGWLFAYSSLINVTIYVVW